MGNDGSTARSDGPVATVARGLIWLLKTTVLLAAIAAGLTLLVVLADNANQLRAIPTTAANTWITALSVAVVGCVLFVAVRALLRLWRSPPGGWQMFGSSPAIRIVSLGIVTLMFQRAVWALIVAPVYVVLEFVSALPRSIQPGGLVQRGDRRHERCPARRHPRATGLDRLEHRE